MRTIDYIKNDYQSNRVRFFIEVLAWFCSVVSSIIFAATVPNVPVVPLYCVFLTGCFASIWSCYTRQSFGLC